MDIRFLVRGAAAAERTRRRMLKEGANVAGQPLWTDAEICTLRRMCPGYAAIAKKLRSRSYWAVRHKAQKLGPTPKRHVWRGAEIVKLRRVYTGGTTAEVRAAFPDFSLEHIASIARRHGFFRPKKPFKPTGVPVLDQIRTRAFELGYSMPDIDKLARSKRYFQGANWHSGHVHHRAIARAISALDGIVAASWHQEN